MKKFLLSTTILAALTGSAVAADMAVKAPPPAPLPVIYNWTGFYIGANGGWGQSRDCWGLVPVGAAVINEGCASRSGGVLGGQIGYRWQASQWVFGVEAQGDWADLHGSRVSVINPLFRTSVRIDAVGLFTGQIGYAWNNALFYVKGGAATTRSYFDVTTISTGVVARRGERDPLGWHGRTRIRVRLLAELDGRCRIRPPVHGRREQLVLGRESAARWRRQPDRSGRRPAHLPGELQVWRLRRTGDRALLIGPLLTHGKAGRKAGLFTSGAHAGDGRRPVQIQSKSRRYGRGIDLRQWRTADFASSMPGLWRGSCP